MISLVTKRDSKFPSELRTNICPSATSIVAALPSASTVKRAPVAVEEGQIVGRTTNGAIVGQKLQPSMVDDGGIPFAKLPQIGPGQVLGVPVNNNVNAPNADVQALDISSVAGRPLTASVAAPNNPQDNNLWYYCGEEVGDAARLYIFRDDSWVDACLLYTSPSPRDRQKSRMPSSA